MEKLLSGKGWLFVCSRLDPCLQSCCTIIIATGTINNATRELAMAMASFFTGALIPESYFFNISHPGCYSCNYSTNIKVYIYIFFNI